MLNTITVMGRLTRDPELRYTPSQVPVASFTLAVERDIADQSGNRQTDFIDCVAWRKTGEFVSKYFSKGSMAVVSGRLQMRDWTDRDGNKRRNAEIVAENVYFGESKSREDSAQNFGESKSREDSAQNFGESKSREDSAQNYGGAPAYNGPQYSAMQDADGELPF